MYDVRCVVLERRASLYGSMFVLRFAANQYIYKRNFLKKTYDVRCVDKRDVQVYLHRHCFVIMQLLSTYIKAPS